LLAGLFVVLDSLTVVAAHNLFYAVLMDSTDYAVAPYDAQFIVYFAYISHLF